jgi:uncharacterized protein (DUF2147 family)
MANRCITRRWLATAWLLLFGLTAANGALAADLSGVWLTEDREARVRFAPCGSSVCGTVVGLKQPIDPETGKPLTDKKNPDASKRQRPMIGVAIALGFKDTGDGKWSGTFYNAEDGRSYTGSIVHSGPTTLAVTGCLLMFCQTQTWTRFGS